MSAFGSSSHRVSAVVRENALWDASGPLPGSRELDQARVHVRFPNAHRPWSTEAHELGKEIMQRQAGFYSGDSEWEAERTAMIFKGKPK